MAQLTEDEYIARPHVLSGDAPWDLCYRYYVEFSPETPCLSMELQETVDRDLAQTELDIGAWSKRCAPILPSLTQNLAIATFPRAHFPRLKRIQIAFLQESTDLLVLVLEEARLLRRILPFYSSADQDQLDQAASRLNGSLGLMREAEAYGHQNHYIDGVRLLLSQPEFSGGEPARNLVQLFEGKLLLGRSLNGTTENEVLFVFNGPENRVEFMNPFGIILYQYCLLYTSPSPRD